MCTNIGYDRGEMFYCRDCGKWMNIIFTSEHAGTEGFMVASMEGYKYKQRLAKVTCSGNPNSNIYDCQRREKHQQISF